MVILSNVEFEKLVSEQSPRLKMFARERCKLHPKGFLKLSDLDAVISVCQYTGDKGSVRWLKSLKSMAQSGKLNKIKNGNGATAWQRHALHVAELYKKGEIAFDLFDHIMLKEDGRRGTVVDYQPESKEFVVALNPFELRSYPKKELEKVAKKV
jgi:hypothetical protein